MRKLFKERKLFKGGNYMRKYGISLGQNSLPGSPIGLHCMTLPDSVSKPGSSLLVPPSLGVFFDLRYES